MELERKMMNQEVSMAPLCKKVMELEDGVSQLEALTSLSAAFDEAFMEGYGVIEDYREGFRLFTKMLHKLQHEHKKLLGEFFGVCRSIKEGATA